MVIRAMIRMGPLNTALFRVDDQLRPYVAHVALHRHRCKILSFRVSESRELSSMLQSNAVLLRLRVHTQDGHENLLRARLSRDRTDARIHQARQTYFTRTKGVRP